MLNVTTLKSDSCKQTPQQNKRDQTTITGIKMTVVNVLLYAVLSDCIIDGFWLSVCYVIRELGIVVSHHDRG